MRFAPTLVPFVEDKGRATDELVPIEEHICGAPGTC
jgi:hypothetical protein